MLRTDIRLWHSDAQKNNEIDLIDTVCHIDIYTEEKNNNTRSSCFFFSCLSCRAAFPFSSGFPRKITSTCNSVATCNASLTRYRKRHSRPLVTTALKRRSIFRWCVSLVLYTPGDWAPEGALVSLVGLLLCRALYLTLRSGGGLALLFFILVFPSFRPVSISSSLISQLQSHPSSPSQ